MESVIAEKYAVALLQVAQEQNVLDAMGEEIQAVRAALEAHAELKGVLEHPRLKAPEKLEALKALMGRKLSTVMENFLTLLILKKRVQHLKAVVEHFERLRYKLKGKAAARVLTAMPLSAAQKADLAARLGATFGLTVELREEVKPGLIGGIMVYLGDERMDGSVLGQLERMKQRLLKVEIE
jgi:F-type H+-transporting ATPase subunit delta